jgi:probable addiction module antidote protein
MPKAVPYNDYLYQRLREDAEYSKGYLTEALRDDDPATFLVALRHVVNARADGIAGVAKATGKGEKSLYKTLSEKGNPELKSIRAILESLGFHLAIA